jgi:hypothetical protein
MVSVVLEDQESTFGPSEGLRCLTCGDIMDALISKNRAASVRHDLKKDISSDYRFEYWNEEKDSGPEEAS